MERCFRVFLLDDDARETCRLERLLAGEGYKAQTLGGIEDLGEVMRTPDPACLILERTVGGRSGLEILDAMEAAGLPVPIIFLVAEGDVATCASAMRRGAVDYLLKPAEPPALRDAVRRAEAVSGARHAANSRRELAQQRLSRLTPREQEVLALLLAGHTNKQIAAELSSRESTVKVHRSRLMRKLETRSLAELLRYAEHVESPGARADRASVAVTRFTGRSVRSPEPLRHA
jgi:FixJ family two-component response regulator